MYDYDCVVMIDGGSGFVCNENTIISENLSEAEDNELAEKGYFFRDVSATEKHIVVNRMDVASLQIAYDAFWVANT